MHEGRSRAPLMIACGVAELLELGRFCPPLTVADVLNSHPGHVVFLSQGDDFAALSSQTRSDVRDLIIGEGRFPVALTMHMATLVARVSDAALMVPEEQIGRPHARGIVAAVQDPESPGDRPMLQLP